MKTDSTRLTALLAILNLAAFCLISYIAVRALREPLHFDDAFMFQHYAIHLREGMGVSWNPDGIHTGGMTSLGWFLVVLPLSLLPPAQGQPLAMGSFAMGVAGIALLALQVSKLSYSSFLKRFWLLFPSLILLLTGTHFFRSNMVTGMDTMLSFTLDVALSCSIWAWCRSSDDSYRRSAVVGLLGACAVIVRPENGILAVVAPLLAALLLLDHRRKSEAVSTALAFAAVLAVYLICYRSYFHAWLPLGFHMKSQHAYRGYVGAIHWVPERYLGKFLLLAIPILALPLMCADRRTIRIAVTYITPVALTFVYLEGVTQIMGYDARYYLPFLAPLLVAAFWMADVAFQNNLWHSLRSSLPGIVALSMLLILAGIVSWRPLNNWSQQRLAVAPYPAPALVAPVISPLPPRAGFVLNSLLASHVIKPLPFGSVVAASEVGLIGAAAPQVAIIDLTGLNDNEIAWHGFNVNRLLDRKPLLIWFPHSDYTWQRQAMFCSPGLLEAYTVIGGNAFDYSLAIRRDTPETTKLMQSVGQAFQQIYPGVAMQDYIVSSIDCNQ
jgi:hypothetical protein